MREGRKEKEQGEGVGEGGREDRTGEEIKQATMKTLMPVAAAIKKIFSWCRCSAFWLKPSVVSVLIGLMSDSSSLQGQCIK